MSSLLIGNLVFHENGPLSVVLERARHLLLTSSEQTLVVESPTHYAILSRMPSGGIGLVQLKLK